jgi:nitrilase
VNENRIRVAAIQLNSGADIDKNLQSAETQIRRAAEDGSRIVVLPENFALMPKQGRDKNMHAEDPHSGLIQSFLSDTAKALSVWIVGGSIPLRSSDPDRVFGASPVFNQSGECIAIYRKMHLFDVNISASKESYRESNSMLAGDTLVTADTPAGKLGLSICYDLRFPEMYRALLDQGASWFTVPAAFTAVTGKAHWQTLIRARAVENLAYVVAPGQFGMHPDGRATWGHSMICDHWGRVLAESADETGFIAADFRLDEQHKLREDFPALDNRRLHMLQGTSV